MKVSFFGLVVLWHQLYELGVGDLLSSTEKKMQT